MNEAAQNTRNNKQCREIPQNEEREARPEKTDLLYSIEENPPWLLSILLGLQHYLTAFGSTLSVPLVLAGPLCMGDDNVGKSELIATVFFMSGIATLLQITLGIRLPIIQGVTFAFLVPTASTLNLPKWLCPANMAGNILDESNTSMVMDDRNVSHGMTTNASLSQVFDSREEWQKRIREIQGAICIASLFQVFAGLSGLVSILIRYIGPLTITPTITLIGLSLFEVAAEKAATHWWIAATTLVLIALFSQYLRKVSFPVPAYSNDHGCTVRRLPLFQLFPVLLAMLLSWLLCFVLTISNALPSEPGQWGYEARTDIRTNVLEDSRWIRVPYPGQWGVPTVSVGAVFGMLAGVLASMMESLGDYYACARLSGAPPPPPSAVSRGILVEGIACVIAGLMGTGNGTTSYSENVGAIGITRVGSRRVVLVAGVLLIFLGCVGKIGALFVTIPDPVVGGMFIAMFGMITAVGLSNLHFVDMRSSRNIFVVAFSIFIGLCFPHWMARNRGAVNTGSEIADQIIVVLLSTSMFVGGFVGFVLDTTLPGTLRERGILAWKEDCHSGDISMEKDSLILQVTSNTENDGKTEPPTSMDTPPSSVYDLPWPINLVNRLKCVNYLPFCPEQHRSRLVQNQGAGDAVNS